MPPLSDGLGYTTVSGQATFSILHGTYRTSSIDQATESILSQISTIYAQSLTQPLLSPSISLAQMQKKLKLWPESTTTSPSGVHLGHYKALIKPIIPPPDLEDEALLIYTRAKTNQQSIIDAHHKLLNYALSTGYTFQRWQTTSSSILRKDPDDLRIHRVRVIHIYEADYNQDLIDPLTTLSCSKFFSVKFQDQRGHRLYK